MKLENIKNHIGEYILKIFSILYGFVASIISGAYIFGCMKSGSGGFDFWMTLFIIGIICVPAIVMAIIPRIGLNNKKSFIVSSLKFFFITWFIIICFLFAILIKQNYNGIHL